MSCEGKKTEHISLFSSPLCRPPPPPPPCPLSTLTVAQCCKRPHMWWQTSADLYRVVCVMTNVRLLILNLSFNALDARTACLFFLSVRVKSCLKSFVIIVDRLKELDLWSSFMLDWISNLGLYFRQKVCNFFKEFLTTNLQVSAHVWLWI